MKTKRGKKTVKIKKTEDLVRIKEKECDNCGTCITGRYGYYVEVNGRRATRLHCIGCIEPVKIVKWGPSRRPSRKELIIRQSLYTDPLYHFYMF